MQLSDEDFKICKRRIGKFDQLILSAFFTGMFSSHSEPFVQRLFRYFGYIDAEYIIEMNADLIYEHHRW